MNKPFFCLLMILATSSGQAQIIRNSSVPLGIPNIYAGMTSEEIFSVIPKSAFSNIKLSEPYNFEITTKTADGGYTTKVLLYSSSIWGNPTPVLTLVRFVVHVPDPSSRNKLYNRLRQTAAQAHPNTTVKNPSGSAMDYCTGLPDRGIYISHVDEYVRVTYQNSPEANCAASRDNSMTTAILIPLVLPLSPATTTPPIPARSSAVPTVAPFYGSTPAPAPATATSTATEAASKRMSFQDAKAATVSAWGMIAQAAQLNRLCAQARINKSAVPHTHAEVFRELEEAIRLFRTVLASGLESQDLRNSANEGLVFAISNRDDVVAKKGFVCT